MKQIFVIILLFFVFNLGFVLVSDQVGKETGDPNLKTIKEVAASQTASKTPEVKTATTSAAVATPTSQPNSFPSTLNVPILTYHYIRVVPNPEQDKLGVWLSVTPTIFREQLAYLKKHGYTTLSLLDLNNALEGKEILPSKPVVLTFDDGYADFYTSALPLLKEFNAKATQFVVAGFVDSPSGRYLTSQQVKELDESNLVTIGVHTWSHLNLSALNVDLNKEVVTAKKKLEELVGHQINILAYPYGKFNNQAINQVKNAGFQLAVSTEKGRTHSKENQYHLHRNGVASSIYSLQLALGEAKPKK